MKGIFQQEWFKTAMNIGLVILVVLSMDFFENIPHVEKMILLIILIVGFRSIRKTVINNRKYSADRYYRMAHENDNTYKVSRIIIGIGILIGGALFFSGANHSVLFSINLMIGGVFVLTSGIIYQRSVILDFSQKKVIAYKFIDDRKVDLNFTIAPSDQAIEFRKGQITLAKNSDQVEKLKYLNLDQEEVATVIAWIEQHLPDHQFEFYQATENKSVKIIT